MIVDTLGAISGTVGGGPLEAAVVVEAVERLRSGGSSGSLAYALSEAGDSTTRLPAAGGDLASRLGRVPRADPRLHAPIGLRLGDKSPAEIAISILAEIVLVKSAGAPLHNRLVRPSAGPPEMLAAAPMRANPIR